MQCPTKVFASGKSYFLLFTWLILILLLIVTVLRGYVRRTVKCFVEKEKKCGKFSEVVSCGITFILGNSS